MLSVGLLSMARLVAAQSDPYPIKKYDLGNTTYKSEKVRCPRTIEATHLNVLRYGYAWNSEVSFDKAPDLWGALITAAAPADTKAPPPVSKALALPRTPEDFQKEAQEACQRDPHNPFNNSHSVYCRARAYRVLVDQRSVLVVRDIARRVFDQRQALQTLVNSQVNVSIREVKNAGSDLHNLLEESSGSAVKTKQAVDERLTSGSVFLRGIEAEWPFQPIGDLRIGAETLTVNIAETRLSVARSSAEISLLEGQLRSEISSLGKQTAKVDADNLALVDLTEAKTTLLSDLNDLDYASKETDKTRVMLDDISETSPRYTQFRDARNELGRWRDRMAALKASLDKDAEAALSSKHPADGEFAFSQTKKTVLTLTRTDLMPGAKDTKPETILDVTVECTSPFTISAGVAFSSLSQREFAIVPSKDPNNPNNVINTFESTSTSSFHPLPLGMIHARVWEGNGWWENVGLHASFGIAGNFRSQSSGGSDVEFLVGPSVSLFRAMFLTPGLHIGQKVELGGGFKEGDVVPPSITQPPLQKAYKLGFGFAITFTKP
jgi:hypothetical protein